MPGSSILPVRYSKIVAASDAITWPIMGACDSALGMIEYCIIDHNHIPYSIQFNLGAAIYGPYYFNKEKEGEYMAVGMMKELDISGIVLIIGEFFTIEIVSIYTQ